MAYNPNVPAPANRVQDDIAAMRNNFQHLAPLAQAVGELQAVSGLAPVVEELQAVSELAPYVQALLGSRIVEMGSNSNGTYVRWENGLQVCYLPPTNVALTVSQGSTQGLTIYRSSDVSWTFPATFNGVPMVDPPNARLLLSGSVVDNGLNIVRAGIPTTTSIALVIESLKQYDAITLSAFAIGRWK